MARYVFISLLLLSLLVAFSATQTIYDPQYETTDQKLNDDATLNYALFLEHLEAAYYTQGLNQFSQQDFADASLPSEVYNYLGLIRDHETSHVALLTSVLSSRGATPVQACSYNFGFTSVPEFILLARGLEEVGVMAYDGAANAITDAGLLQAAATIATIEARHASYLNAVAQYLVDIAGNDTDNETFSSFPNPFDMAQTPRQIASVAYQYVVNCPQSLTLPVVASTLQRYNFSSSNFTFVNVSGQQETQTQIANDNAVLFYSATLETFGGAFYAAVANFTLAQYISEGFTEEIYNGVQMIIMNERAHLNFLRSALASRGA